MNNSIKDIIRFTKVEAESMAEDVSAKELLEKAIEQQQNA